MQICAATYVMQITDSHQHWDAKPLKEVSEKIMGSAILVLNLYPATAGVSLGDSA
jgi:hypothetical protein